MSIFYKQIISFNKISKSPDNIQVIPNIKWLSYKSSVNMCNYDFVFVLLEWTNLTHFALSWRGE